MSLQELVVVTGMSGSGKGTVLKAFEDLGFFCIDNLPIQLIPKFIEGIHVSGGIVERAALVIDIRAGEKLRDLEKTLSSLREFEFRLFVLYLEARDAVLVTAIQRDPAATSAPRRQTLARGNSAGTQAIAHHPGSRRYHHRYLGLLDPPG